MQLVAILQTSVVDHRIEAMRVRRRDKTAIVPS
jgi:hypothetical protein